jgi:hypothetical protein
MLRKRFLVCPPAPLLTEWLMALRLERSKRLLSNQKKLPKLTSRSSLTRRCSLSTRCTIIATTASLWTRVSQLPQSTKLSILRASWCSESSAPTARVPAHLHLNWPQGQHLGLCTMDCWSSTWSPGFIETTMCSSKMGRQPTPQNVPRSGWPPTCLISGPRMFGLRPAPTSILLTFPSGAFSRPRPVIYVRPLTQVCRL